MKLIFDYNALAFAVHLTPSGKTYRTTVGQRTMDVEMIHLENGKLDLLMDGQRVTAYISSDHTKRWVTVNGQTFVLTKPAAGARQGGHGYHHAPGELTAPMPGQIRLVNVSEGDGVTKGQTLMVLEAMKMEIRIHAPQDGMVRKLFVKQGQTVEREQILIEVEEN